jgi:glycosyltransferase involved in cell wall biosynthesis
VGTNPPSQVTDLEGSGINVTGRVPDLAPFFGDARVFVAPLLHGAGIKIKVLESLGHGVPTVVTSLAAEGLHLTDGVDTLIADSPDDFAAAVIRLYSDEDLWGRLVAGGYDLIERHFSRATMETTMRGVLELATDRG